MSVLCVKLCCQTICFFIWFAFICVQSFLEILILREGRLGLNEPKVYILIPQKSFNLRRWWKLSLGSSWKILKLVFWREEEVVKRSFNWPRPTLSWIQCDQIGWLSATIILSQLPTFFVIFCKGVEIFHFSSEIFFGQLLQTFGNFVLVTLAG